jgi:NitT/TauT family transport system substrate-binding protein
MRNYNRSILALCLGFCVLASPAWSQVSASAIRLGVFADADSLPLMVCESEGLFMSLGIDVTLIRFQSAVERDSAFQAGALDGMISDLPAVILAAQAGFQVGITSLTDGRYGIIAAPNSGARSLSDLAGKPIGISSNTVIHYMADSFLGDAGLSPEQRNYLPVPKMPVRLEMVLSGQLAGAGMPEPFLTMARTRGGILLAATDDRGLGAGVLVFSRNALSTRLDSIRLLYRAYWTAAQRINASPDKYRALLVDKAGFSPEAASAFVFVVYRKPRLPSQADIEKAKAWLVAKGLLKRDVSAAEITDPRPAAF